ncbi:MAG: hypothetical protein IMX01_07740 [Limnochordaceae bacterium]|nr:hypothetical protein [Limnochordaceae bacterium]
MGLWIMVPIALLAAILLWDRERLFTLEKALAVVNIVVAAPWFISMGLQSGADLFDDRLFQAGWYLAGLEVVVGALALVQGWRHHGLAMVFAGGAGRSAGAAAGDARDTAAIAGTGRQERRGPAPMTHPAMEVEQGFSWARLVDRTEAASPWILGYGLVLAALMGWAGRFI